LISYNFTGYNPQNSNTIISNWAGMTNLTTVMGVPAFVTLANYNGVEKNATLE